MLSHPCATAKDDGTHSLCSCTTHQLTFRQAYRMVNSLVSALFREQGLD